MRITSSMYYKDIYGQNNSKLSKELFDVNKQIASGLQIQYAKDDVGIFVETMRLDNEMVVLGQIQKSTESGYKFSNQSDVVLSEFEESINKTRTLLIQAANGTNDDVSLDAIAQELRAIESNFKNLANTSINGQYLFSGSAVDIKPINDDGTYNGNDVAMSAFTGSGISQQYNITGTELFFGEETTSKRQITSNVVQSPNVGNVLDGNTTMADYNGTLPGANQHHFYLRGTKSDGTAFKTDIQLGNADTIDALLTKIGEAYGNTGSVDVVNVSMNADGQIVIEDKMKGSSKLDFHMVGAADFNAADNLAAITDIDALDVETTDYATASAGAGDIFVREYTQSSLTSAGTAASNIEGIVYDRAEFSKNGSTITSNAPQILKETNTSTTPVTKLDKNAFATPSTKISDVADLSQGIADTLDGTTFNLEGTDINGVAYSATVDFTAGGSTFTVGGNTYNIYNADSARTPTEPDDMTYQQLMDVMNMVTTDTLPATVPGTAAEYDTAIKNSSLLGNTHLTYDGKIEFNDLYNSSTNVSIALYDSNSDNFAVGASSSVMTFNTNNALTVTDPKTDFFKTLDDVIKSVEDHKLNPDSSSGDPRNVGIQNAISMLDDLSDHVFRSHSKVGAQSNALTTSLERTSALEISTMTLRSSVIDTDLAEASLELTQLNNNYQAMLSTVGQISQLSLVNYL
ncbi:MAG: flagellar biosynthesis protein FlgL [Sulfurimonas sp.]|uniref:flagellin N-terminal helical domain-containing protein n=1 Tax=Sulfurimonas sp. TaxID=2022749 RepID=UPI002616E8D8|nr:flagellar biosynthesis protein FlgL [Sulfurimonas sp.]MCW8894532.1 flagellar biosynthesis protein FlgL [Sulfurimonas sp.]MCW8955178.1 flagellar biosynthesis protein FlgL [Sulfurimonas sp.]MCW9067352.1 flagellar biosynthesis protein FlgL [Sulfurimonas sp.]